MRVLPAAVSLPYASRAGRAGGVRPERARCLAAPRRRAHFPARCTASGGDDASYAGSSDDGGEAGRDDAPGEPPVGGDAALQDLLVDVLRFETAKLSIADQVSEYVAGEQENLRALVEQARGGAGSATTPWDSRGSALWTHAPEQRCMRRARRSWTRWSS